MTSFKYLGAFVSDEGSNAEVLKDTHESAMKEKVKYRDLGQLLSMQTASLRVYYINYITFIVYN